MEKYSPTHQWHQFYICDLVLYFYTMCKQETNYLRVRQNSKETVEKSSGANDNTKEKNKIGKSEKY